MKELILSNRLVINEIEVRFEDDQEIMIEDVIEIERVKAYTLLGDSELTLEFEYDGGDFYTTEDDLTDEISSNGILNVDDLTLGEFVRFGDAEIIGFTTTLYDGHGNEMNQWTWNC